MRERSFPQMHHLLIRLVTAITLLGALASGAGIWLMRSDAIDLTVSDARNLATVLGEQTVSSVQSIELVIHELQQRIDASGAKTPDEFVKVLHTQAMHEILIDRLSQLSQADVISVADRDGNIVNFTRSWPIPPINLSDRDYFRYAKNNNDGKLYISLPVPNKVTGTMTLYFSKRIDRPDGEFVGIVLVGVNLDYFRNVYHQVNALNDRLFALVRSDGTVLLRYPGVNYSGVKLPASSPWYQQVAKGGGHYRSPGIFDGNPQLVAVQPLKDYPLVLDIIVSERAALGKWYPRAITIGVGVAVALLCLGALRRMLGLQLDKIERSEAELAKRSRDVEVANLKFDLAVNNVSQGICLFNADNKLLMSNTRFQEIYGLTQDQVKPGTPLRQILRTQADSGEDKSGSIESHVDRIPTAGAEIIELADGRVISIRRKATPDGSWVATHEEITEQKRLERKLFEKATQLEASISNMPSGLCMFDKNKRLVVCNQLYAKMYELPAELLQPGTLHRDIIADRVQKGILKTEQGSDGLEQYTSVLSSLPTEQRSIRIDEHADGKLIRVVREPMDGGGWVAIHEDITEQKRLEASLAEKAADLERVNTHFEAALDSMSQGLCLYDKNQKVIVSNRRYGEMYRLSREQTKPGTTLRQILEFRREQGSNHAVDADVYVNVNVRKANEIQALADGRYVLISRHQMREGGWLTVHEDITERRKIEQERDQNRAFLNQIVDQIPTEITVKDARDRRYVLVNRIAEQQLGLSADQVIGKTDYEIYPKATADAITADDDRALQSDGGLFLGQHAYETRAGGTRFTTAKRVSIRNADGAPTHLINVVDDVTEIKRSNDRIAYLAHHDQLTGIFNRASFADKLDEAAKRCARHGTPFTVLMIDLDKFKDVNDTLGHPAGDQLLIQVAQRLKSSLRDTDMLARLGGDEFAIIQEGEGDQREGAIGLALRIIDIIGAPFDLGGNQTNIGASIGIAFAPECGLEAEGLLKKADLALYEAKAAGRSDYRLFEPQMAELSDTQRVLEGELRAAIQRDEFELHYQPVVDVKTGSTCGFEALVRWRHPLRGLVPPDRFIPLAESTGLILPLGEWILQRACRDAAAWPASMKVAVNLSAVQFNNANIFEVVLGALVESGLSPERLELEITETMLLKNEAACFVAIRQLKNLGISIALDDFGIGYSSPSYLTRVPFDIIKIDKSFVQGFPDRRECAAIIQSVLALGRGLDMLVTAEGVERREQFESLRDAGVDLAQGHLFGRPMPVHELVWNAVGPRTQEVA